MTLLQPTPDLGLCTPWIEEYKKGFRENCLRGCRRYRQLSAGGVDLFYIIYIIVNASRRVEGQLIQS